MNFMSGFSEDHHHQIPCIPCSSSSSSPTTLHRFNVEVTSQTEKEHMFDKVVTPSDVGKLNRLVIPKQHAERYFPLDSSTNEKGLLLNFEDINGKPWRFRYSYWNSSQSYVMTKGWSRFVKEKKLDAGDIVSFHRGTGEVGKDRLFIDWRRRPDAPPELLFSAQMPTNQFSFQRSVINPWNPLFFQPTPSREYSNFLTGHGPCYYNTAVVNGNPCPSGSILYLRSAPQQVGVTQRRSEMVFESVPVVQGKAAAAKRMRLFGVNMDCPVVSDSDDHQCDMLTHPNFDSCSSPTIPSLLKLRPCNQKGDKGKGSMSLDLEI